MRKMIFGVVVLLFTTLLVASCDNYPEGPIISLVSKTERVANNWKIAQATDDETDVTANYDQYELDLSNDGVAELTAKFILLGASFDYITSGTWSFTNNAEKISFDFENNNSDGVYTIQKLTQKEMWLKKDAGTLELHYVPK